MILNHTFTEYSINSTHQAHFPQNSHPLKKCKKIPKNAEKYWKIPNVLKFLHFCKKLGDRGKNVFCLICA